MKTTLITTAEVLTWGPCAEWTESRIASVFGEGLTFDTILDSPAFTNAEKAWLLGRLEVLTLDEIRAVVGHAYAVAPEALQTEYVAGFVMWPDPKGAFDAACELDVGMAVAALRAWCEETQA